MQKKEESPRGVLFAAEDRGIGAAVLECFTKNLPGEPTKLLTTKRTFSDTDFSTEKWTKHIKESFLQEDIKELTTTICEHISERMRERIDPNHPHHLMCFELIMWLITTLHTLENNKIDGDITDANRKKINARINYISALTTDRTIFSPDKEDDKKLIETLKKINGILLTRILQKFLTNSTSPRAARKKTSPRAQKIEVPQEALMNFCASVSALKKRSIDILEACVGFLFHLPSICPDLPKPEVAKLCQKDQGYQIFLGTRFGQLFQALLMSEEFKILFNLSKGRLTDRCNPFLNANNELHIPEATLKTLYLRNHSSFSDFFQENPGIHSLLVQNEDALKLILKMLALLWELSKLVVACEETNNLAALNNGLICFRPTQEQIRSLMESFDLVISSKKTTLKAIVACITETVPKLPPKDQRTAADANWAKNLIQMKTYYGLLAPLVKDLSSLTQAVKTALADIPYSENFDEQVIAEFRAYIGTMIAISAQTQSFCKKDKDTAVSPATSPASQRKAPPADRPQEKAPSALAAVDPSKKESPRGNPPAHRPAPPTTSPTLSRHADEGLKSGRSTNSQPAPTSEVKETQQPRERRISLSRDKYRSGSVTRDEPPDHLAWPAPGKVATAPEQESPRAQEDALSSPKGAWPAPGKVPTVAGQQSPHSKTASPTPSPRAQEDSQSSSKATWTAPGQVSTVPSSTQTAQHQRKPSPATSPRDSEVTKNPFDVPTVPPKPESPRLSILKGLRSRSGSVTETGSAPNSSTLSRKKGASPRKGETASDVQWPTPGPLKVPQSSQDQGAVVQWPAEGHVNVPQAPQDQGAKKTSSKTSPRENESAAKSSAQSLQSQQGPVVIKTSPATSPRESVPTAEQAQLKTSNFEGDATKVAAKNVASNTATQPKRATSPTSPPVVQEIKKQVSRSSVRDRAATWGKEPPKNVSESPWNEPRIGETPNMDSKEPAAPQATSPQFGRARFQSAPAKASSTTASKSAEQEQKPEPKRINPPATVAPKPPVKAEKANEATKEQEDAEVIIITRGITGESAPKPTATQEITVADKLSTPPKQQDKPAVKSEPQPTDTSTPTLSALEVQIDSDPKKEPHLESTAPSATTTTAALTIEKPFDPAQSESLSPQQTPAPDTNPDQKSAASFSGSEPIPVATEQSDAIPTENVDVKPPAGRGGLRNSGRMGSLRFKSPPKIPASTVAQESRKRASTAGAPPKPNTMSLTETSVRQEATAEKVLGETQEGTQAQGKSISPNTSPRTSQVNSSGSKPASPPLSPETIAKLAHHRKTSPRPSAQSVFEKRRSSRETSPRAAEETTTVSPNTGALASHEASTTIATIIARTALDQTKPNADSGATTAPNEDRLSAIIREAEALRDKDAEKTSSSPRSNRDTITLTEEQVNELSASLTGLLSPPQSPSSRQSTDSTTLEADKNSKQAATPAQEAPKNSSSSAILRADEPTPSAPTSSLKQETQGKTPVKAPDRIVNPEFLGRGPTKAIKDQQSGEKTPGSGSTSPRTSRAAPLSPSIHRKGSVAARKAQFDRVRKALSYQNTLRKAVDVLDQDHNDPNVIFLGQDDPAQVTVKHAGDIGEPHTFTEQGRLQQCREEEARKVVTKENIILRIKEQLRETPTTLQLDDKNLEGICVKLLCDFLLADYDLYWDTALRNDQKKAEHGKIYITQEGDYFVRTPTGNVVKGSLPAKNGIKFLGNSLYFFENAPEEKHFDLNHFGLKSCVLKSAREMQHILTPTELTILKLSSNSQLFSPTDCSVNINGTAGPVVKKTIKEFPAATALSLLLQKDKSLRTLSLADCNFFTNDDENLSFRTFMSGLRDNESLEMLDLSRCSLTNSATIMLNRALLTHPKITVLLLRGNPFDNIPFGDKGQTAGKELLDLVTKNKNIVFIDLQESNLPADIVKKIEEQADENGIALQQTHSKNSNGTFGM